MTDIDSEINGLRLRLAALEAHKQITAEKKAFPLETLEEIVDKNKNVRKGFDNKFQNERWHNAQDKLTYLEPILNILKGIQERLDVLEKK
jgi:hypothetical protein